MTAAARQFISPFSAATLSGQAVRDDLFSLTDEAAIGHIELSRAADLIVVAPASAHILARMAGGLADDMATTVLLATDKRVLAAPAMNVRMWLHPATRRNLDLLKDDGVLFVGPELGPDGVRRIWSWPHGRAAGDRRGDRAGVGRRIGVQLIRSKLPHRVIRVRSTDGTLSSLRARPMSRSTRWISSGNRSSGRQGHAIAQAAIGAGARVLDAPAPSACPIQPGPRSFMSVRRSRCETRSRPRCRRCVHRGGGGRRLAGGKYRPSKDQKDAKSSAASPG